MPAQRAVRAPSLPAFLPTLRKPTAPTRVHPPHTNSSLSPLLTPYFPSPPSPLATPFPTITDENVANLLLPILREPKKPTSIATLRAFCMPTTTFAGIPIPQNPEIFSLRAQDILIDPQHPYIESITVDRAHSPSPTHPRFLFEAKAKNGPIKRFALELARDHPDQPWLINCLNPGYSFDQQNPSPPHCVATPNLSHGLQNPLEGVPMRTALRLSPLLLAAASAHGQAWTVTNLHPAGTLSSYSYGGSPGEQVGMSQASAQGPHARLWNGTVPGIDLNPAGSSISLAFASSGGTQGGYVTTDRRRACIWTGSAASWIDLAPANASSSEVRALDGGTQVGVATIGQVHASAWFGSPGSRIDLNPAIANFSEARGVKNGQVVGYYYDPNTSFRACLWTALSPTSYVDLHPGSAYGYSDAWATDGIQHVGYAAYTQGGNHAILWTGSTGSYVDLAPTGSFNSECYGVANGMQVGLVDNHATVWTGTAASAIDINPAGYSSSFARAIWTSGGYTYISGYGVSGGQNRALLWQRALPCPANCDASTSAPILTANDFQCFLNKFAQADPSANCDGSTTNPTLTANDFQCFLNQFAAGCP